MLQNGALMQFILSKPPIVAQLSAFHVLESTYIGLSIGKEIVRLIRVLVYPYWNLIHKKSEKMPHLTFITAIIVHNGLNKIRLCCSVSEEILRSLEMSNRTHFTEVVYHQWESTNRTVANSIQKLQLKSTVFTQFLPIYEQKQKKYATFRKNGDIDRVYLDYIITILFANVIKLVLWDFLSVSIYISNNLYIFIIT